MFQKMASTFGTLGLILLGTTAFAETPFKLDLCGDARTKGWSYYCAPPVPVEEPAPEEQEPVVVIAAPPVETEPTEPVKGPATQAILAFRAQVDEIKYKAVLDPTPENVQAYMEIQKQLGAQAGKPCSAALFCFAANLIAVKELRVAVGVARQHAGHALGQARMACERSMLGPRKRKALPGFWQEQGSCGRGEDEGGNGQCLHGGNVEA